MVRDDKTGTLRTSLQAHINTSHRLLGDAEDIYEPDQLTGWRERLTAWRTAAAVTLEAGFEQEAVLEFLRATAETETVPAGWQNTLSADTRRLRNALELLVALQATLIGHGGTGKNVMLGANA
jgi:hypothetical protein